MSLSQPLRHSLTVLEATLRPVLYLCASLPALTVSGCASAPEQTEPPPVAAAATLALPKPAPTAAPDEVWLSISEQEAIVRLRHAIKSGQSKLKLVSKPQATPANVLEARTQPKAGAYLDCGTARITTIGNKSVVVPAAKSFQQFRQRVNGVDYSVWRSMHLLVLARLEVKPRPGGAGASVRFQPSYSVTRERLVTGTGRQPMVFRDTVQFGANETGTFPNSATPCRSNGRLERELRDMLSNLERSAPETTSGSKPKPARPNPKPRAPAPLQATPKDIVAGAGGLP